MNSPLLDTPVSVYDHARATVCCTRRVSSVLDAIQEGSWAKTIQDRVRAIVRGRRKADLTPAEREGVSALKLGLSGATFSATFASRRCKTKYATRTPFVVADVDEIGSDVDLYREALRANHYVSACWTSVSGTGLAALVRVDPEQDHATNVELVAELFRRLHGLTIDPACKDISRLTYIPSDPKVWTKEADVLTAAKLGVKPVPRSAQATRTRTDNAPEETPSPPGLHVPLESELDRARAYAAAIPPVDVGARNATLNEKAFLVARTFKVDEAELLVLMRGWNARLPEPLPESEVATTVSSAFRAVAAEGGVGTRQADEENRQEGRQEKHASSQQARPLPPIESVQDLVADTSAVPPPQVVHGLLHAGLKAVISAPPKSNSSWLLLDLAESVQAGVPFWRFQTTPGRAIYLNFEIPRPFFRERAMCVARAKDLGSLDQLDVWTLRGHAAALGRLLPEITKRMGDAGYSLAIIDPIFKGMGGRDENKAQDVAQLVNEVEAICTDTGAAVVYRAHHSKGNQSEKAALDRIVGSGVFGRDADVHIDLTPHETENCYGVNFTVRNLPPVEPITVEWRFPLFVARDDLDPASLRKKQGAPRRHTAEKLLALLPLEGLRTGEWRRKADEEAGIPKTSFYELRDGLKHAGQIIQSPLTGRWITKP